MAFSKVSIACFLLLIIQFRLQRWIVYLAAGVTCLAGITFTFAFMFQCRPVSLFWNKEQFGYCIDIDIALIIMYCYSVLAIITDFTFTILPIYLIWNLQMDRKTKLALMPIMGMANV